jgi:acetolactate synthase-1/2/3 large subunit
MKADIHAPSTQTMNGANIVLKCLEAEGVDVVFGYPGGVILPIYEALPDYPGIQHILVRHEQGATHMAEGYARTTGKPGVVLATSGPGATNTVTGIADAYYDSVPLVVLTGNVPTTLMGNDAFQEADILSITRACTKHNLIVRDIQDLASAMREAFFVATTGRPGPVVVDLPKDILNATAPFFYPEMPHLPGYDLSEAYNQETLNTVLDLLKTAERPMILSGGGVVSAGAHEEVTEFARRFNIPVTCSLMGLGGFPASDPLFQGFCGMHGHYWTNIAIANADVLIVAGNRLNDRQTGKADRFARNAKIIHIDLDPTSLQKNVEVTVPVQGEIRGVFQQLLAQTQDMAPFATSMATRPAWFEQIESWKQRRKPIERPEGKMTPQYVIDRIFQNLPKDACVTTEVGQHQMWAAQSFNLDAPRSFITSGGLGTMGFGFPAAIGIQAAYPERLVVDVAGDGSFQMTLQELATAKIYGLNVVVAIINNARLGMIRQWQGKMFGRESEAYMWSPDYVKLAEAYGCKGIVIDRVEDVDRVLQEVYAHRDCPVLLDFRVAEQADVYPWVPAGASNEEMLTEN